MYAGIELRPIELRKSNVDVVNLSTYNEWPKMHVLTELEKVTCTLLMDFSS